MTDFKPKQGERIQVRNHENSGWCERTFVVFHDDGIHCETNGPSREIYRWAYGRATPAKTEPIPFTHETWPKQVVWLRFAGNGGFRHGAQVIDFFADGVCLKGTYQSFEDLMAYSWEMPLDFCQTWQPCHYVPESE